MVFGSFPNGEMDAMDVMEMVFDKAYYFDAKFVKNGTQTTQILTDLNCKIIRTFEIGIYQKIRDNLLNPYPLCAFKPFPMLFRLLHRLFVIVRQ